jgi:hypothetical protein
MRRKYVFRLPTLGLSIKQYWNTGNGKKWTGVEDANLQSQHVRGNFATGTTSGTQRNSQNSFRYKNDHAIFIALHNWQASFYYLSVMCGANANEHWY